MSYWYLETSLSNNKGYKFIIQLSFYLSKNKLAASPLNLKKQLTNFLKELQSSSVFMFIFCISAQVCLQYDLWFCFSVLVQL